jgi:hypothetical protein
MAAVYSDLFSDGVVFGGDSFDLVFPDTSVWIIRNITLVASNGDTGGASFGLAYGFIPLMKFHIPDNHEQTYQWEGRQVIRGGGTIVISCVDAPPAMILYYSLCGYVLSLP